MSCLSKNVECPDVLKILVLALVWEVLAILAWVFPILNLPLLLFIAALAVYLLYRQPIYALYLPLAELIIGSFGRSFAYGPVSVRQVLFIVIILFFAYQFIVKKVPLKIREDTKIWLLWLFFCAIIVFGIILGWINGHSIGAVFYDANAYFFILYLPVWWQVYETRQWGSIERLLRVLTGFLAVKTLLVFSIFTQNDFLSIKPLYDYLRDLRWGEMTMVSNNFYRIFSQSQLYLVIAWFLAAARQIQNYKNHKNLFYLVILSSALYISLSRSFFLGLGVGALFLLLQTLKAKKINWQFLYNLILLFLGSFLLILVLYNVPKFHQWNIFSFRSMDTSEAAASSRQALLNPMLSAIRVSPLFGHGFGQELSFYSSDPRNKNIDNPSGWRTTYAFEWGWLDFMVKTGLLLLGLFVVWFKLLYTEGYAIMKNKPIFCVSLAVLSALIIIHIFSPFLNHPLGLGVFMLSSVILRKNDR